MPRLSKIGAAALAAFGWTGISSVTVSYLVVAGGGGTGGSGSGGGGAGGLLTGTTSLNPTLSYTVTVGAGGAAGASPGAQGSNGVSSQFGSLTATVGGGAGGFRAAGFSGGSGGGGGALSTTYYNGGAGTSGQGNTGGNAGGAAFATGGGGGAGAVGANGASGQSGAGGAGTASSITGSSATYAGGGGGGGVAGSAGPAANGGAGGSGGGGTGGTSNAQAGTAGTANTGGGGGGGVASNTDGLGGAGGSGVVIISYVGAQQFGGGVVTSSGGSTIHTFTTSGALSPLSSVTASYLVVAGGAATDTGGGGAGGLLSGSGLTLDANSIYTVTVGAGGTSGPVTNGTNSSFSAYATAAVGGGRGGNNSLAGQSGGSGGGGYSTAAFQAGGSATSGQGNAGGNGNTTAGGGGGGAGAVGTAATSANGGAGGAGTASSISGTSVTYAGGGGGGGSSSGGTGGSGGGGAGATSGPATAGTANTGGGGGGSYAAAGGTGGSGIVIISYAGATQLMAGGTVTISGGNVIHTFTSSGYLTPIELVSNSLRFRASASAYLNRTPASAGNRNTWTWSGWIKRSSFSAGNSIFSAYTDANNRDIFQFDSETLQYANVSGGSANMNLNTTQVFRDVSAWYHILLVADTTQATSSNRLKMYVNGSQITAFSTATYPAQNANTMINNNVANYIAREVSTSQYANQYMTEINFIDGQALTPSSFGTIDSYGVWQPITYGGSYGTNGFYLPFSNTTSTTTLGYDFSPQGNNWTTNNISLTAGTTYDSMTDVPTLTSATAANFCTINPLSTDTATYTLSNANLTYAGSRTASATAYARSTIGVSSGKWYWEAVATNVGAGPNLIIGVQDASTSATTGSANLLLNGYGYGADGLKNNNAGQTAYGATWTNGDVIGVAFDLDAGTITFYKNNTSQGVAYSSISGTYCPVISMSTAGIARTIAGSINFGQQPFTYTAPSGFLALNTFNL